MSLLPVTWKDGWPLIGDISEGVPGKMVWQANMPYKAKFKVQLGADRQCKLGVSIEERSDGGKRLRNTEKQECAESSVMQSDEFESETLGPQWQWNYQPRDTHFSLTERPGWLRLRAFRPVESHKLLKAGNTLTQRSFRTSTNEVTVKLDISHLAKGQRAGLCHMAEHSGALGVVSTGEATFLEFRHDDRPLRGTKLQCDYLWLRSSWGLDGRSTFSYSTDGKHFVPFGQYRLSWGFYRGDRIGIYCFNDISDEGYIDVDYLHYQVM